MQSAKSEGIDPCYAFAGSRRSRLIPYPGRIHDILPASQQLVNQSVDLILGNLPDNASACKVVIAGSMITVGCDEVVSCSHRHLHHYTLYLSSQVVRWGNLHITQATPRLQAHSGLETRQSDDSLQSLYCGRLIACHRRPMSRGEQPQRPRLSVRGGASGNSFQRFIGEQ